MAHRKPNPPRHQHGFVKVEYVRCPDCEYEGALRNDGGAKVIGGQLRGMTVDAGITKASSGCETCKGRGSLEVPKADDSPKVAQRKLETLARAGIVRPDHRDPYSLPLTPEQAARMRRRG